MYKKWVANLHMRDTVFYLPGRGGEIKTGLGQGLLDRGFSVTGRETRGAFLKLNFQQQLDAICSDLQAEFWHEDAKLVAVSYGCYLFLHAQICMPASPGACVVAVSNTWWRVL